MIRLLEGNYRKMEKIIRILSISDKWMTKKELAKRIGSSESTFVRYIEEIKIRWGTDVTIQSSQKLGYRLEHLNVPAYLNVLMEMSQSSTNSRLLNEIIVNPGKTIEYYCEKISISRSSFTRKLKQCNQILESYLLFSLCCIIIAIFSKLLYEGNCHIVKAFQKQINQYWGN